MMIDVSGDDDDNGGDIGDGSGCGLEVVWWWCGGYGADRVMVAVETLTKIVIIVVVKMMKKVYGCVIIAIVMMILMSEKGEAVTCSPVQLSPCLGAITSSSPPSSTCCQKVREQRPCLCGYLKNPSLKQYVNSPGSRRVANACGVPFPTC
ncbi:hypothetical protein RJT34_27700 [Clitoria ternatea]|uniref:Bifunctional inhibitor/plant lipid transfer protein/seed storage helical domain-containing protein n=1 Tax=Clitoria ternatea TaxID=43366 RepID=A0AAN9FCJ0_CLITE